MKIERRTLATWFAVFLGLLLIVNGLPRVVAPVSTNAASPLDIVRAAKSEDPLAVQRAYRDFLQFGALSAAVLETILGVLLVLGAWTVFDLVASILLFLLFTAFLIGGAALGMPVARCNCFSFIQELPLKTHLIVNGVSLVAFCLTLWGLTSKKGTEPPELVAMIEVHELR